MIIVKKGSRYLKKVEYQGVAPKNGKDNERKFAVVVNLDEDSDILYLSLIVCSKVAEAHWGSGDTSEEPCLHLGELPEFALHGSIFCSIFEAAGYMDLDSHVLYAISTLIATISTLKIVLSNDKVEFNLEVQAKNRVATFHLWKSKPDDFLIDWLSLE